MAPLRQNPEGCTRSAGDHIASACPTQCTGCRVIVIMDMGPIGTCADGIGPTTDKEVIIPVSWRHSMPGNLWNILVMKSSVTFR
jgi:hypothetical protein